MSGRLLVGLCGSSLVAMLLLGAEFSTGRTESSCALQAEETVASPVEWRTNLEAAVEESKTTHKPLLIAFTASWCRFCHKMQRETFTDKKLAGQINENFVPLLLDADQSDDICEELEVEGLPATCVVSSEGKLLKLMTGYQTTAQIQPQLAPYCQRIGQKPRLGIFRK